MLQCFRDLLRAALVAALLIGLAACETRPPGALTGRDSQNDGVVSDRFVEALGVQMRFRVIEGNGPGVVLEAGSGLGADTWAGMAEDLSAATGATVISYDRAGMGESHMPPGPYDIYQEMARLHRGLVILGHAEDLILVGHSYGGVVISEVGMDPDVRGLVYVAAFQPDAGESGGALLASAPSDFTADGLTVFEDGHYLIHEDAFLSVVANGMSDEDAIFVARAQAASHSAILEYQTQSAAWTEKPSWSVIATLDRTIAPDLQRRMAERAGSTVTEIENGHMLPMTSPEEVAAIIRRAAEAVN